MNKKLLFIYNPHSGKGIIKQNLSDIMDIFIKNGYDVTVHTTQSRQDATKKVIDVGCDFDRIVCSGGDGTLNEVTKGFMKSEIRDKVTLGYIPTGSTNDFGYTLGLSNDILLAASIAVGETKKRIDVGRFNEDYFVYVAAFGIFTEVSYQTDQTLKNFFGHAAYVFEAIKSLQEINTVPLQVEADGKIIRGDFIYGMVTNALQVGGMKDLIRGDVKLSDGLFEVMLIRTPQNPIELAEIGSYLTNIKKDTNLVYTLQAREVKFTSNNEIAWTLDGEFGGKFKTAKVVNEKQAINMVV